MALLELSFADHAKLVKEGRNFDCSTCKVQNLRRCNEPRWDFSFEKDGNPWPMYVSSPKGELYGFCPAKVARDDLEAVSVFRLLVVVAETGQLLDDGGINAQPSWLIDELSWFLPRYGNLKTASHAAMVFGSGDDKPKPQPEKARAKKGRRGV